jgi:hypothetical protein
VAHAPSFLSKYIKGEDDMQRIRNLFGIGDHTDDIYLRVKPISHGGFGVYANAVLIAVHTVRATADAHCLRLRNQQAIG